VRHVGLFLSCRSDVVSLGNPKGVVLTHETVTKGIICQASGMADVLDQWVLMSYLPLAHMSVFAFCSLSPRVLTLSSFLE
jgi:long-subunit acyl-CoA synthetase (AMP-forming)